MHSLLPLPVAHCGGWQLGMASELGLAPVQSRRPQAKIHLFPLSHSGALCCVPHAAQLRQANWKVDVKGHHNGTEGSYLKAVASGAKSLVARAEDSFVDLFKFHHVRDHVVVLWAAKPSSYFHVYNCEPH